ncbi:hypothetical protein ACNS7O_01875 [Haloferacaceae archaeon DSL9]
MSLKRIGVLLFALGVVVASLSVVVLGVATGCTEAACPGHEPSYALDSVDLTQPAIYYTDGCNTCSVNEFAAGGAAVAILGAVLGSIGAVRDVRKP